MKISFKRPEDVLPSAMILLSIAILVGTLLFMLLVQPPSAASVRASHNRAKRQLNDEIRKLNAQAVTAQAQANARLWQGDPETVSTSILSSITAQANRLSLKVAAFRPQRTILLAGMTELPYNVQISGPYEKVRAVMESFDEAKSKVALRSIQIATSAVSTSNDVTATLIVSAYLPAAAPTPAPTRTVTVTTTGGAHGSR